MSLRHPNEVIAALLATGLSVEQTQLVIELAMSAAASAACAIPRAAVPAGEEVWVYVIAVDHPGDTLVKVGISKHPHFRMNTLEKERGFNLYLAHTEGPFSRANATLIERKAHNALLDDQEIGEWFWCGAERAIETVRSCAAGGVQ